MRILGPIKRIFEEILPFVFYFVRSYRQRRRSKWAEILSEKEFANYIDLSEDKIEERLKEEHQRASTIDEKTSKLTISFSIALTFVGATIIFLKNTVSPAATQTNFSVLMNFLISFGLFYSVIAGLVALGALRPAPRHGYGTLLLLEQDANKKKKLAESLARQEIINIVRQLRNEAAFQSLRNGLWLFLVAIAMFVGDFAYRFFSTFALKIC